MVRERTILAQGTIARPPGSGRASSIRSSSAAFTLGWSRGWSRNHQKKTTAHTMPGAANTVNAHRQPTSEITHTTSSGVTAPPQRVHSHITLTARFRSRAGSQLV